MPAITFTEFSGGLDRRLPIGVQDANRLYTLRNGYVTLGKKIRKRPGLREVVTGITNTVGLMSANGNLLVFGNGGAGATMSIPSTPGGVLSGYLLTAPSSIFPSRLVRIHYAEYFQGYPYIVAEYDTGNIFHHYLDGTVPSEITDVNCPNSASVTKAASRIFATGGEVVRYCAAGDARDWTTSSDAGFLPVTLQQDTKANVSAVGTFQDALVTLFPEGAQVWDVATDPSANKLRKRLYGIGTNAHQTLASFASDLVFLSPHGFRSMTVSQQTDRIDDTDMGAPVDPLVVPDISTATQPVTGLWIPQFGQYWALFTSGSGTKAWVYTFSRSSKIACWSEYAFPVVLTDIATLNGKVYARSEDTLYELAVDQYTDDGELIDVEVQMAFQDAKTPGVAKMFWGADMVLEGAWSLSFKFDPRDLDKETLPQALTGDTRPGEIAPVEVVAPAIAPVFRHAAAEPAEIDALTLYYEPQSVNG